MKCKICETEIENKELLCPLCGSYTRISPTSFALLISILIFLASYFFVKNELYQAIISLISILSAIKNLFHLEKEKKQIKKIKEENKDKIAQRMREIDLKIGFITKSVSIKKNSEVKFQNGICVIKVENDNFEITYDKFGINFSIGDMEAIEVYKEKNKTFFDFKLKSGDIFTFQAIGKEYEKFIDFKNLYNNKI